ncbi:XRE family transcriptional regulator [Pseudomonas sp. NPDC087358]|uniref:XRE family transcriptional regulator n=1 Tax=Pseudomonas sp. NPDC087358 TaxID=3364439 RepID=UPI00384FE911
MVLTNSDESTFADRLRHAMKQAGFDGYGSTAELSRKLEVTPKAVAKWLHGESMPSSHRLIPLAALLNVDAKWLLWGTQSISGIDRKRLVQGMGLELSDEAQLADLQAAIERKQNPPPPISYELRRKKDFYPDSRPASDNIIQEPRATYDASHEMTPVSVWDDETPVDDDEVEVPFLREVALSAGSGRTVIEEHSNARLRFGKRSLRKHNVQFDQAICVPVHGNSMEPVLPDGSTVAIDRGTTNVVDGKIYALAHAGQLRVKTLYRLPGGGIRLRSFNQAEHRDEEYTAEQMVEQEIVVLGKVFWSAAFH